MRLSNAVAQCIAETRLGLSNISGSGRSGAASERSPTPITTKENSRPTSAAVRSLAELTGLTSTGPAFRCCGDVHESRPAIIHIRDFLRRSPVQIAFDVGIFFKGFDGVLEIVGGLLLFLVKPETISRIISALTQHELNEDSHDLVARALGRLADQVSADSQTFAGVYLLSHGVIKVFLVEALFRGRLWAYPTAIAFFAVFIAYQMYRYALEPSVGMIVLSVLDLIVIGLTWLEYRRLKGVHGRA
jgi:uncharacterized membrane protein